MRDPVSLTTVRSIKAITFTLVLLLLTAAVVSGQKTQPNSDRSEVFVLSTLHQIHDKVKNYSFDRLSQIIKNAWPDVICVELTAADLKSRRKQNTKVEYERSVFPLADKYGFALVPMEPDEPAFSTLVTLNIESEKELREQSPAKADAFKLYTETLYEHLFDKWDSALAVNSAATDSHFEVKHNYQNAVYGDKQQRVWENWNRHFLDKIIAAEKANPGKRILVLVGVEHAYWLRRELRKELGPELKDVASLLK